MKEKPETKLCKYCKTEIPYDAKVCPQCKKKQGKGIVAKILIALLVLGVIGALFGDDDEKSTNTSNTEKTVDVKKEEKVEEKVEEVIEYTQVSVEQMMEDLSNNALKAKETYEGKYLEITGIMNNIDSDGKYITLYKDEWSITGVHCNVKGDEQKSKVMDLTKGQNLTLRVKIKDVGEVLGYTADIIEFVY